MIRLYHCAAARSFRALWALEELKLPYELIMMPFPPRALFPNFRESEGRAIASEHVVRDLTQVLERF